MLECGCSGTCYNSGTGAARKGAPGEMTTFCTVQMGVPDFDRGGCLTSAAARKVAALRKANRSPMHHRLPSHTPSNSEQQLEGYCIVQRGYVMSLRGEILVVGACEIRAC